MSEFNLSDQNHSFLTANSHSASQKIARKLRKLKIHHHIHKIHTLPIYIETNQSNTHPQALSTLVLFTDFYLSLLTNFSPLFLPGIITI